MKKRKLVVGTGWCAWRGQEPHQKHIGRSRKCMEENWYTDYWVPAIAQQIKVDKVFIYYSLCEVYPLLPQGIKNDMESCISILDNKKINPRHDFNCSVIMGAQVPP